MSPTCKVSIHNFIGSVFVSVVLLILILKILLIKGLFSILVKEALISGIQIQETIFRAVLLAPRNRSALPISASIQTGQGNRRHLLNTCVLPLYPSQELKHLQFSRMFSLSSRTITSYK